MKKIAWAILGAWFFSACPIAGLALENGVDIHGFLSQGYMLTERNNYIADSTDGTFQFNEMGINFTTTPVEKLRMGVQFFARDFGTVGNDKIVVDWALADYRFKDWLGVRAGKLKNPMGLYNETRDIDMLRTSILLPVSVYDEPYRETVTSVQGVGIYGDFNSDNLGTLNYQLLCGTNNIDKDGGTALFVSQGWLDIEKAEVEKILSGAIVYTDPTGSIRIGGTAYFIEMNFDGTVRGENSIKAHLDSDNVELYTASIEWSMDSFLFVYEYFWGNTSVITSLNYLGQWYSEPYPYEPVGYYGSVSYRITPYVEVGYFRMEYFFMDNDRNGSTLGVSSPHYIAWQKEDVVSLRIDLNENWLIKLETHYIDGAAKLYKEFNHDGFDRYWWNHLAKISYKF